MPDNSRTALRAPSQPATQRSEHVPARAVGQLERCRDAVGLLLEAHQLGVPLHGQAELAQLVAHDAFVVVLAEDEDERIGRDAFPASPRGTRAIRRPCAQMLAPVPRLPSSSARSTMPSCA